MPNVLILGATGYIGFPLAQSLLRSGNYTVYGLARNAAKANHLTLHEITPIRGDVSDISTFSPLIASAPIDIVVDTTNAYEHASTILNALIAASKSRIESLAREGTAGPKLGFVYTSGSWVHGSPKDPVSDLHPIGTSLSKGTPAKIVSWRPRHEQAILAAPDVLDVAIVRPAEIYGCESPLWGTYWSALVASARSESPAKSIKLPVGPTARPPIVHVDDVVSGMHAAVDRVHGLLGSWPVFDLVGETVQVREVMEGIRAVLGLTAELEYVGTQSNPFFEAMGLVSNSSESGRARIVLGWEPKRRAFLMKLALYVAAWEAAQMRRDQSKTQGNSS
ncbi:hypothetical protein MMC07_006871 [Pseudocyphellaria aurata]|nr:hypothetical protein [Pseudocyphellaria aurata]